MRSCPLEVPEPNITNEYGMLKETYNFIPACPAPPAGEAQHPNQSALPGPVLQEYPYS